MTTENKLRELRALDIELDSFRLEKKTKIDDILTSEIKKQLDEVDEYYQNIFTNLQGFIDRATAEIKAEVLENKTSIKDGNYQAVYTKGRTTWDTKALSGYALAHPEIESLRKIGEPSVDRKSVV